MKKFYRITCGRLCAAVNEKISRIRRRKGLTQIRRLLVVNLILLAAAAGGVRAQDKTNVEKKAEAAAKDNSDDEKSEPEKPKKSSRPPFGALRFDEDYGFLRDPAKRTEPFDRLKYIRLRADRDDWYLSLGGEIRPYYQYFRNFDFGRGAQDPDGYVLHRFMLHADFRFGQKIRVFAQLNSGLGTSRRPPLAPPDVDKLDINALFVDFNFGLRKSEKRAPDGSVPNAFGYLPPRVVLRVGRQELNFGSGRLVSVRNGPNMRQVHDGVSLIWRPGKWRVDAVVVKPVTDDRGYFDDAARRDQTFWAAYASRPWALLSRAGKFDVYYLGFDRKRARFDQGAARELRHSFGARFWNGGRRFDYDLELTAQAGRFGDGDIRAWSFSPSIGYTFADARFKPRLGLDAGIASGDRDPRDKNLNTFAPPFPRGQYFGAIAANGPYNIQGFRPSIRFSLPHRLIVGFGNFWFWRQSRADGLYNVPGVLIRTGRQSRAWFIGNQPEVEALWQMNAYSRFELSVGFFIAGRFLRETPPGKNMFHTLARYTFQF